MEQPIPSAKTGGLRAAACRVATDATGGDETMHAHNAIACPKCNATPGKRCMTTGRTGKPKKRKLHAARMRAAKRT
ncbi:MAG: hypothetical protein KGL39_10630 [Patescibacteria group bacterium]|nr:hypothetical protein [Patescibacteria group bacterium]